MKDAALGVEAEVLRGKTCPKPYDPVQPVSTYIQARSTCFLYHSLLTPYFINFQRNEDSNPVGLIAMTAHSFLAEDKEMSKSSSQPVSRI